MTFEARETSQELGNPVQLFRFDFGALASERFAYTDHTEEITTDHGGAVGIVTYSPVPIRRGPIQESGTLDNSTLSIDLDVATGLAELFRIYPPSQVVNLVVYTGHIDDPDSEFLVTWAGRLTAAERNGSELNLVGEPITTQMRRPGLRRHYQYGCPLLLYGQELGFGGCSASKAAGTVTGTVASIAGNLVTLDAGWEGALPPAKFLRGQMEWTPAGRSIQRRSIIRVAGDVLTLSGIPTDIAPTDSVDLVLGCNRRAFAADGGDCEGLHNALTSYGGQPWIPTVGIINKNPYY